MKYQFSVLFLISPLLWANNSETITVVGEQETATQPELSLYETDTLSGQKLKEKRAGTLGETLSHISGVQGANFGPTASRPIIRGLGGHRVQIMVNSSSVSDMSSISEQHRVDVEPFFAESITVIKGPASILYGDNAIAGAVIIDDGRIQKSLPEEAFSGAIQTSGGYNTPAELLFKVKGYSDSLTWNVNGLHRKGRDMFIPSKSKDEVCRDWDKLAGDTPLQGRCQVYVQPQWDFVNGLPVDVTPEDQKVITEFSPTYDGRLKNTHFHQNHLVVGSSLIKDTVQFGAAVSYSDGERGIPGFMNLDSKVGTDIPVEPIRIHSDTLALELYGNVNLETPFFDGVTLDHKFSNANEYERMGATEINHFDVETEDTNLKVGHSAGNWLRGIWGVQRYHNELKTSGIDNFLPSVETSKFSYFAQEVFSYNNISLELGARADSVDYKTDLRQYQPGRGLGAVVKDRDFDLENYTAALSWQLPYGLSISARKTWAERAPGQNELYASNNHLALQIEEQGSSMLETEKNTSEELSAGLEIGRLSLSATYYQNDYENFIYRRFTGMQRGNSPVYQWSQADFKNHGTEINIAYDFDLGTYGLLALNGLYDRVVNEPVYRYPKGQDFMELMIGGASMEQIDQYFMEQQLGDYLPRLPVSRYGAEARWIKGNWIVSANYMYYAKQDKVAKYERPSASSHRLNLRLDYEKLHETTSSHFFIALNNVTDQEIRSHQSFLRHLTPERGMSVKVGYRYEF